MAISEFLGISMENLINGRNNVNEGGLEAVHLYGKLKIRKLRGFHLVASK